MPKQLNANEILFALARTAAQLSASDGNRYVEMMCELGNVLGHYAGFECHAESASRLGWDPAESPLYIGFSATGETPRDGGVLAQFDTDVTVEEVLAEGCPEKLKEPRVDHEAAREAGVVDYLVVMEEDVSPIVHGPLNGEKAVLEAALAHRKRDPDAQDGLYLLSVTTGGGVLMNVFGCLD